MLEIKSYFKINKSSERNFGFIFATIFLAISLYPILQKDNLIWWSLLISFILYLLCFFKPNTLRIPNILWFRFGILIGNLISPIVMGVIFFIIVTPTAIIMKLIGKDLINIKIKKSVKSYWIKNEESINSMEKQF